MQRSVAIVGFGVPALGSDNSPGAVGLETPVGKTAEHSEPDGTCAVKQFDTGVGQVYTLAEVVASVVGVTSPHTWGSVAAEQQLSEP